MGDEGHVARVIPRFPACVTGGGGEPVTGIAGLGKDRAMCQRMNQSLNKYLSNSYCVPHSNARMGAEL